MRTSWIPAPLQLSRRTLQFLFLALLVATPVLARYVNYLSARELDRTLRRMEGSVQGRLLEGTDAALRTLVGDEERAGARSRDRDAVLHAARQARGTTWSLELFGVTLTDPLAVVESAAASRTVRWVLVAGALIPILVTILLGRVFCSWVCPVGLMLELTGKVRSILRFLEIRPGRLRVAAGSKHLILVLGVLLAMVFGAPFLGYFYPPALLGRELHNGITVMFDRGEEGVLGFTGAGLTLASWFIAVVVLVELVFAPRLWCRSLCPGGALYTLLGRFRLLRVRRDPLACTGCGACVVHCEMGLSPMTDVTGMECDNCGACIAHCGDDALHFRLPGRQPDAPRLTPHQEVEV